MIAVPTINRARVGGTRTAGLVHRPPARDPSKDEKGRAVKWFRLYHSIVDSLRVRKLPDDAQLDYFLLLCLASEYRQKTGTNSGNTGMNVADAAWRLRRGTLEGTFPMLQQAGLAALDKADHVVLIEWEDRQFLSDDVTARTLKYKGKTRGNVPRNVPGNVPGNVREGDTERTTTTSTKNVEVVGAPRAARRRPTAACPHEKIVELYHAALPNHPRVELLNPARERHLNAWWKRWMQHASHPYGDPPTVDGGIDFWRRFFEHAAKQPNLTGKMPPRPPYTTPFVADFDYLIGPESHMRVAEARAPE